MNSLVVFSLLFVFAAANDNPIITSVFYNAEPYCNERCPLGFEYVESLGNCYRILLELGPVSQDRAVLACALNNGSALPSFQAGEQIEKLRAYFYNKYGAEIEAAPGNTPQAGFWTAYVRQAGDGTHSADNFVGDYLNMYSGDPISDTLWAMGQPNNDNLDQACVARKRFGKEYLNKKQAGQSYEDLKEDNGLDDYQCPYPHWVICSTKNVYALNKRAYNTAIMAGAVASGGECELDWVTQSKFQFDLMIDGAKNESAWREVAAYESVRDGVAHSKPVFDEICMPGFNYKCD